MHVRACERRGEEWSVKKRSALVLTPSPFSCLVEEQPGKRTGRAADFAGEGEQRHEDVSGVDTRQPEEQPGEDQNERR
jgi:hypothetical protein